MPCSFERVLLMNLRSGETENCRRCETTGINLIWSMDGYRLIALGKGVGERAHKHDTHRHGRHLEYETQIFTIHSKRE